MILIAVLGTFFYLWMQDTEKIKKWHKTQIDSVQRVNENLINQIWDLKDEVIVLNIEQDDLEALADSLAKEANKPMPCQHELEIRKQENVALRGSLKKCKEAKAIQGVTIKKYDSIIVNHEVIIVNHEQMQKIDRKEKKKSFLKGAGTGGALGIILTVLILL